VNGISKLEIGFAENDGEAVVRCGEYVDDAVPIEICCCDRVEEFGKRRLTVAIVNSGDGIVPIEGTVAIEVKDGRECNCWNSLRTWESW
jgi:hypothetical protein